MIPQAVDSIPPDVDLFRRRHAMGWSQAGLAETVVVPLEMLQQLEDATDSPEGDRLGRSLYPLLSYRRRVTRADAHRPVNWNLLKMSPSGKLAKRSPIPQGPAASRSYLST
jgi:hypothetical protein